MIDYKQIKEILSKEQRSIFEKKGVIAVGIGYKIIDGKQTNKLSLICSVDKKVSMFDLRKCDIIPTTIKGVHTDVVETGIIKALHTNKHRPAPGGVSVGHVDITCGTLGCVVRNQAGFRYILSNNHVLACSNDAKIGDSIVQPGTHDSGTYPKDHIANLTDFVQINFSDVSSSCPISKVFVKIVNGALFMIGSKTRLQAVKQTETNLVDAAIARPLKDEDISDEIMEVGKIVGVKNPVLGMKIKKSGRTTGLTTGEITQVGATVKVQYGAGKIATFTDQFMAGGMSEGGDSGSVVLDVDNKVVGLLFGGSDTTTVMNKIDNVFRLLNIGL